MKPTIHLLYIAVIITTLLFAVFKDDILKSKTELSIVAHPEWNYTRYLIDFNGIVVDSKNDPSKISWIEIDKKSFDAINFESNGIAINWDKFNEEISRKNIILADQNYAIHKKDNVISSIGFVPNPDLVIIANGKRVKISDGLKKIAEILQVPNDKAFSQKINEPGERISLLKSNAVIP